METYDVVVIGGGAAGLSGARARRRVLVPDAGVVGEDTALAVAALRAAA